jgi:hypothetical protein|tara:strand:+ start:1973 stop:2410 length:438 start_codon:yes stop_codon:yes gene_type:complete
VFILKISEQIEKTYKDFEVFFKEEFNLDLKKLDMSEIRDKFKELVLNEDSIFGEVNQAEDTFLYIYHYRELQEIKRVSNYLLETNQPNLYKKFLMEFFSDSSPSGLEELKVHQINNESDKLWFSRDESSKDRINSWRSERFNSYI